MGPGRRFEVRRVLAPAAWLVLAVVHTPVTAQARLFDFLPAELRGLNSSEPFVLLLTGIALLSLARLGPPRRAASARIEPDEAGSVDDGRPAAPPLERAA